VLVTPSSDSAACIIGPSIGAILPDVSTDVHILSRAMVVRHSEGVGRDRIISLEIVAEVPTSGVLVDGGH